MVQSFVFPDDVLRYDRGPRHPLKTQRLKLTLELIQAYGLLERPGVRVERPPPASRKDLLSFHTDEYVCLLEAANAGRSRPGWQCCGIGTSDNPIFPGLYDYSLVIAGASLAASRAVAERRVDVSFSMAGGMHHARKDRASGFCYINDPVIAILDLLEMGLRVVYLDLDVHHGDGVQWAFYDTDRVLTVSLHQDGRTLFPGTGGVEEIGRGAGLGYSVNIPLWPGTGDDLYLRAFEELVVPLVLKFDPDVVVTQLGVDTMRGDCIGSLDLTTAGIVRLVKRMKALFPRWVVLGGGGYDLINVMRSWTLAWAEIVGEHVPDEIPSPLRGSLKKLGLEMASLHAERPAPGPIGARARESLEDVIRKIRRTIFPIHDL